LSFSSLKFMIVMRSFLPLTASWVNRFNLSEFRSVHASCNLSLFGIVKGDAGPRIIWALAFSRLSTFLCDNRSSCSIYSGFLELGTFWYAFLEMMPLSLVRFCYNSSIYLAVILYLCSSLLISIAICSKSFGLSLAA
jgi:hypothetical protein